MDGSGFLRDLAIVMLVAGVASILFRRLRQPALLGYILAGMLIGPHAPGMLIADQHVVGDIADLGVVLLMFTLGLDFSIRKLRRVGGAVMLVAVGEVAFMFLVGFQLGLLFGWDRTSAMFLGGALGLSSTMVVVRVLRNQGLLQEPFARNVVSLLVAEDVLSVVLITILTAVAIGGSIHAEEAFSVLGHLLLFVVVFIFAGLLVVPRLLNYVATLASDELLLLSALGVCFGTCLLAEISGLSVALGAFLAGAVVAESKACSRVAALVAPLRDMFAALFFVAIGLMVNPAQLLEFWLPALIVALAVIVGKTVACGLGTFIAGHGARRGLRTGLSMAAIGEFSFVIVAIGAAHGVLDHAVYPTVAAVAVICMAVSPQLLARAQVFIHLGRVVLPASVRRMMFAYTGWLAHLRPVRKNAALAVMFRRLLWHIAVNVTLVVALFIIGAYADAHDHGWFRDAGIGTQARHALIWATALFLSLPMLVAVYRKAEALGMLLAELGIRPSFAGRYTRPLRRVLARLIPLGTLLLLGLMVVALSSAILPRRAIALALLGVCLVLALILWPALVRMHAHFQAVIRDTLEEEGPAAGGDQH